MRSKTSIWFETKYRYDKTNEDGTQKRVTELFVVEAISFTDAEATIIKTMEAYIEAEVKAITIAPYTEVLLSDSDKDNKFYKVKVAFITIDERNGKERKNSNIYLVQAPSTAQAERYIKDYFAHTMIDYEVQAVKETQIIDLFEYHKA